MKYRTLGLALLVFASGSVAVGAERGTASVSSTSNFHPGVSPVGPSDPVPPAPPQVTGGGDYYGVNPLFRRFFKGKTMGGACASSAGGSYVQPAPLPNPGGTLVFPNHPFMRSPRDFFMIEVN